MSYFTPTRSAARDALAITCLPTWGRLVGEHSCSLPLVGRQAIRSEPVGVANFNVWEMKDIPTGISKRTISQAQSLRKDMTKTELKLWNELRALKNVGLHVRKQVPIGKYITDFTILKKKIIIEVDGDIHETPVQKVHDKVRDQWLAAQGFKVLRFSAAEIYNALDGCVEEIMQEAGVK